MKSGLFFRVIGPEMGGYHIVRFFLLTRDIWYVIYHAPPRCLPCLLSQMGLRPLRVERSPRNEGIRCAGNG